MMAYLPTSPSRHHKQADKKNGHPKTEEEEEEETLRRTVPY